MAGTPEVGAYLSNLASTSVGQSILANIVAPNPNNGVPIVVTTDLSDLDMHGYDALEAVLQNGGGLTVAPVVNGQLTGITVYLDPGDLAVWNETLDSPDNNPDATDPIEVLAHELKDLAQSMVPQEPYAWSVEDAYGVGIGESPSVFNPDTYKPWPPQQVH